MGTFLKDGTKRTTLFLILSAVSLIVSFFFPDSLPIDAAWLAVVLCGIPIVRDAAIALVTKFDIKADLLVSLALIAAIIIGEVFAAGEVAFIMTIGAMLEERTVSKARAGIEKLVCLTPRTARVIQDGEERIVAAETVQVGETLRVFAGETIAVDGVIVAGQTSVDQSVMTGEAIPVDKDVGDEVSSGTVNQFGSFDMRACKVGEDSSIQRMIRLVESADAGKAKIVGIADRWATWIVVAALVLAALTWLVTGEVIRAVTVLVVFCPCALVLATPTAIMAGIGNVTRFGILVREGDALERLSTVSCLAFDKTGTLTHGTPRVVDVSVVPTPSTQNAPNASQPFSPLPNTNDELLSFAASAERLSEHPLGKAIVSHYRELKGKLPDEPTAFQMIPGRGVLATVSGKQVLAGNSELLFERGVLLNDDAERLAQDKESLGCTVIHIVIDGAMAGIIALADKPREDARQVVKAIQDSGIQTVLLTGDNERAAATIGKKTGVTEVFSECLPKTKLQLIERLQNEGRRVCMVGDGINDAPALKKATIGIAMGGIGSDIAIDASDIALVGDDIRYLPHLLALSKKTMLTIRINLTASMALNFVAIILAMTGILDPVVGALVHNVGSVVVIVNSSLLLQWRDAHTTRKLEKGV
ncbi:MAG: cation-translocating P-type ATPase [Coriobacteriales bacterium]|jgi:heavy metal translocating P-type ATPase|nr:cation-translocating P-type ATPase [Coriobacteriales bacterium]